MERKRHSGEEIIKKLRSISEKLAALGTAGGDALCVHGFTNDVFSQHWPQRGTPITTP